MNGIHKTIYLLVAAGRFAPAATRCGFHPPLVRRKAPHNQRIHLSAPVHDPFGLIAGLAGDPQRVSAQ